MTPMFCPLPQETGSLTAALMPQSRRSVLRRLRTVRAADGLAGGMGLAGGRRGTPDDPLGQPGRDTALSVRGKHVRAPGRLSVDKAIQRLRQQTGVAPWQEVVRAFDDD